MRVYLSLVAISILPVLSISSQMDDFDVFGGKFGGDVHKLLESFVKHTKNYGWFLEKGLRSFSTEAMLKASFWVEYACYYYGASYRESYEVVVPLVLLGNVVDVAAMVSLVVVETRFRNVIGDFGRAVGYYQIHMDTAINALEFVNSTFPKLIWTLPLKDSVMVLLKDLVQRPLHYKNNPKEFEKMMMANRPIQSIIAGFIYLHKAFMSGERDLKNDAMREPVSIGRYLVLDLTKSAPVYWNSKNWLHYSPKFFYHYSKAVSAYSSFLKRYLRVETLEDYEKAVLELEGWRKRRFGF